MKTTYRILRGLGLIAALWIIVSLISGFLDFNGQMNEISLSPGSQESGLWMHYLTGAIPFALMALILLLPYGLLPRMLILICGALLCLALGSVGWSFIRPFVGIRMHLDAIPLAAWWTLTAYFVLASSQLVTLFWRYNNPSKCF